MNIVLFSDIHANLIALKACFEDIDQRDYDAIYCLGDLVGYNVYPNEVVEFIRQRKIPTIAGNYDYGVGLNINDCGCAYSSDFERNLGSQSIAYTNQQIKPENRSYLRKLPAHIKIEYRLPEQKPLKLLLVHGSPRKINEYLYEERSESSVGRMMIEADADILCFGHTHIPYHKIINTGTDTQPHFRHAINIGSVGKPKDGNPDTCYVILNIDENSNCFDPNAVKAKFVRVAYDVKKAAEEIKKSPLPSEYAERLLSAS